jgi:hypothetical protein
MFKQIDCNLMLGVHINRFKRHLQRWHPSYVCLKTIQLAIKKQAPKKPLF